MSEEGNKVYTLFSISCDIPKSLNMVLADISKTLSFNSYRINSQMSSKEAGL